MNILFINPPRYNGLPVIREDRCEIVNRYLYNPPYSLIQIAAFLKEKGEKVGIIDANIENLSFTHIRDRIIEFNPAIIVFRFTPETIETDMNTARIAKSCSGDIIVTGLCWTLREFSKQVLKDYPGLDIYIAGEYGTYEVTLSNIIDAINGKNDFQTIPGITFRIGNKIISTTNSVQNISLDYPFPAYDLIPSLSSYYINPRHREHSPFTIMYTSMGCPYNCTYCVVRKTKWQARSVNNVMSEIIRLKNEYNIRCILFKDETFTMDRERTIAICNEMIRNKII